MDPIILDTLLGDDATSSDRSQKIAFWCIAGIVYAIFISFAVLLAVVIYWDLEFDDLLELPALLLELVGFICRIIYRSVNEQAQTTNANMVPLPVPFMKSANKLEGAAASYAPWHLVEKQPRMVLFTKKV